VLHAYVLAMCFPCGQDSLCVTRPLCGLARCKRNVLCLQKVDGDLSLEEGKLLLCSICLSHLTAPVQLSCSHAFCWGCITMYRLSVLQSNQEGPPVDADVTEARRSVHSNVAAAPMNQLHHGWAPLSDDMQALRQFSCPVCQQGQELDLDTLAAFVDQHHTLRKKSTEHMRGGQQNTSPASSTSEVLTTPRSSVAHLDSSETDGPSAELAAIQEVPLRDSQPLPSSKGSSCDTSAEPADALLPPQPPHMRGKLSIVLDIDGTLIASFPPRRALRLPPHMVTHLVGVGSALNPQGTALLQPLRW
jgi:hypothetical protein